MSKKKMNPRGGLVYSTDPNFNLEEEMIDEQDKLPVSQQELRIRLDTKHRAGKAVTLVEGYTGSMSEKEGLCKKLKTFCGTGGSVKDNAIIIQGDNRDKVLQWLLRNGYLSAKRI